MNDGFTATNACGESASSESRSMRPALATGRCCRASSPARRARAIRRRGPTLRDLSGNAYAGAGRDQRDIYDSVRRAWTSLDIATVGAAGTRRERRTGHRRWSGADITARATRFNFYGATITGDGELVARVNSLDNTDRWAKAGLMLRDSLDADSPHGLSP